MAFLRELEGTQEALDSPPRSFDVNAYENRLKRAAVLGTNLKSYYTHMNALSGGERRAIIGAIESGLEDIAHELKELHSPLRAERPYPDVMAALACRAFESQTEMNLRGN